MAEPPRKIIFDNYDCIIRKVHTPTPTLRVFTFELPEEKEIHFIPGQYMSWVTPDAGPAPFSIASSPADRKHLEFAIQVTGGKHTAYIKERAIGDHAILRGPFGRFVMENEKKVAFLAGGVGITPFMSMLRAIRDLKLDVKATLFWSCKSAAEFEWTEELTAMERDCPNIKVHLTLTGEKPAVWEHHTGRINDAMIVAAVPDWQETTFYSCGPPALIEAMATTLKNIGLPDTQFKREKW